jgi:hypothetical protein
MNILWIPIEATLLLLSSWTLAYHLLLVVRLPALFILFPFLGLLFPLLAVYGRTWIKILRAFPQHWRNQDERLIFVCVLALALALGIFSLAYFRPSNDDFSFFHRALVQIQQPELPFILGDTGHNVSNLPALSVTHLMTSYEMFIAIAFRWIGIDTLAAYQNISAFLAEILLVAVYFLLYRQVRFTQRQSIAATTAMVVFLFFDGNLNRSLGGIVLLTMWMGKTILWGLWMPLSLLVAYHFLRRPTWKSGGLVIMAGIGAVGLSGTGLFMFPILVVALALAYIGSYGCSRRRLRRAVLLSSMAFYPLIIAFALKVGILPQPQDISVWAQGWPAVWWQNLALVIGDGETLLRNLLLVLLLPLISLIHPLKHLLVFFSIILCLIFANPILGPIWLNSIQPGAYWRLVYLFPIPLCAGFVVGPSIWNFGRRKKIFDGLRIGTATIIFLVSIHAVELSVVSPAETKVPIYSKALWEYKLPGSELEFARRISESISNTSLLAPESIVAVLGLINPTVRFETTRPSETLHLFRNHGLRAEGERRITAQKTVATCNPTTAFWQSLNNVDAFVLGQCSPQSLDSLINLFTVDSLPWTEVDRADNYILFLRHKGESQ